MSEPNHQERAIISNVTIRNVDEEAWRRFRMRAVEEGRTTGELFGRMVEAYLATPAERAGRS